MPRLIPRRPLWRGLLAAGFVIVALAAAAAVVIVTNKPHNVSHPNVEFTNPTTPTAPPKKIKAKAIDNFQWPVYGYRQSRTREFDGAADLKPPLHVGWTYNDGALLEFPPVIYHEAMFLIDDDASAKAIDVKTGKVIWQRQLGTLAAASPVVAGKQGEVLMPTLSSHRHSPGYGSFSPSR